jgi:hypothetical protein
MFVGSMITPWWWSEEAFDLFGVKAGHELQQQAVVQPSARSLVADLRILYTERHGIVSKLSAGRFLRPES